MKTPSTPASSAADTPSEATSRAETSAEANATMSAEKDVSAGMDEVTAHPLDDIPQDGPLDFDDGTVLHPRGDTRCTGGTWDGEGADSGDTAPPAEIMSEHVLPSSQPKRRE